jgi:Ca2+-binding EF-hand superfamily protein
MPVEEAAVNRAKSVILKQRQQLEKACSVTVKAREELEKQASLASTAMDRATQKSSEAKLLTEANKAKQAEEEAALEVKQASEKEAAAREAAVKAERAAKQATEAAEVERLEAEASEAKNLAALAAASTQEALDKSISTSNSNAEVTDLMRRRQHEIAEKKWTAGRIFAIFDANKDGELDKEEILTAVSAIIERVPTTEQLTRLYAKYDANGDGKFSLSELTEMVKDDFLKPPKGRRTSLFKAAKPLESSQSEKNAIASIKETLMAKEIMVQVNQEAIEAHSEHAAIKAEENVKNLFLVEAEFHEEELMKALARAEKVAEDISKGDWTTARVFSAFDKDLNGYLDLSELKLALTAILGRSVTDEETSRMATTYDADGDGRISYDEFEACVSTCKGSGVAKFIGGMLGGGKKKEDDDDAAKKAVEAVVEMEKVPIYVGGVGNTV